MIKDSVVLITGTGTFGKAMCKRLLELGVKEIRLVSRGEKGQWEFSNEIKDERVRLYIADIRDYSAMLRYTSGVDYVFHSSAMKHIDKCSEFPEECIGINIFGSLNVIRASIENKVKKVIFLSTDKATNATTTYGASKFIVEQLTREIKSDTVLISTRYGNVVGSNGSVVPLFKKLASEGKTLTITNPDMTRFFMSIEQAVDLVLFALENGKNGDLFVYNNKSCTIKELADCFSDKQVVTGVRCIEKTDEALLTVAELNHSELIDDKYYRVNSEIVDDYDYAKPLTSDNADRLSKEELLELIRGV